MYRQSGKWVERLENRRLLSASTETLAIGSTLYTAERSGEFNGGSDLYRSDLDGSDKTLLGHWDSGDDQGPRQLFALGSKLLFTANYQKQDISGAELWASDGTAVGTTIIADLYEVNTGSYPHDFHVVNGRAVFIASYNSPGNLQLYSTDGTKTGTERISPFLTDTYYGAVSNVSYSPTEVTWDQEKESVQMTQRLSSTALVSGSGDVEWKVLYTEAGDDGVVRFRNYSNIAITQDSAGNSFATVNGETFRFRTADVRAFSLTDTSADDVFNVDASVKVPVTFSSFIGDDQFTGGGGLNTLDLSEHYGTFNDDHVFVQHGNIVLNDSGGTASYNDGSTITLHGAFQQIVAGAYEDTITGTGRAETLLGGGGDDSIVGNGGGDSIDGGAGADRITASKTHDTIVADAADTITDTDPNTGGDGGGDNGGGGNDGGGTPVGNNDGGPAWTYANGVVRIYGTTTTDDIRLVPSASSIKLMLNGVTSKVLASKVSTVIINAGDGDDFVWLRSMAVKSKIYGGAGDDAITTSDGKDRIYGGDGNDSIEGGANHDTLYGEAGDDRVMGGDSSDYVSGGAGTNVIRGEGGYDHIVYTKLDDVHGNLGDKMDVDEIVG